MRLQVDNEFQQVKIKDLNNGNNVEMLTTSSVRGGKAFAAEQKIRELKTRIAKLGAQKLKTTPTKIIQTSALNMNNMKRETFGLSPEEIEKGILIGERFKRIFNMHRLIEKIKKFHDRLDRYDKKHYFVKRKKLRDDLMISEKALVSAQTIKKKAAPGKFYEQSVQNISYFNKDMTSMIRKKQSIDIIKYYWLRDVQNNRKVPKKSKRTELFTIRGNFVM